MTGYPLHHCAWFYWTHEWRHFFVTNHVLHLNRNSSCHSKNYSYPCTVIPFENMPLHKCLTFKQSLSSPSINFPTVSHQIIRQLICFVLWVLPRFYIVVLGSAFIFITFIYFFQFLFGLLFPFYLWNFYFPFSLWIFI